MVWVERDGPFTNNGVARSVAYGQVGAQLDMLYHELRTTGTISQDGDWYQHITNVKSIIPKPAPVLPKTLEEIMAESMTSEPGADKEPRPSTQELPAWKRYTGWTDKNS